jgi:hypothetical protein
LAVVPAREARCLLCVRHPAAGCPRLAI